MTDLDLTMAGSSSEEPAIVLCTKCKQNPRSKSNSSWCKQCHNEHAAIYRLRARPRETVEERVCAWKDCDSTFTWRSTHAKQECCSKAHYMMKRYWDARPPEEKLPEGMKRCSKCGELKCQAEFYPSQYERNGRCKICWREYSHRWQRDNKDRRSASSRKAKSRGLLRKFGAYTDDLDQIVEDQGGACASCGGPPGTKGFQIDHDHGTGAFRGLLCSPCNLGLGTFQDDIERMEAAIRYLMARRDVLSVEPSRQVVEDTGTGRTTA